MPPTTEEVRRVDYHDAGKVQKTDEGFLFADAPIAKVGVMTYMTPSGPRNEFVGPEQLFNSDSMDTAKLCPLTNLHPKTVFVTPENAKEESVGSSGENVRQDGDFLRVPVKVTVDTGIQAVKNGRTQLSCGYRATVVKQDGVWNGIKYSHVQTNRRYNHIALVDHARAGSDVSLRLDSSDGVMVALPKQEGSKMSEKVRLDSGREYECAPEVKDAYNAQKSKIEELQSKLDDATAQTAKVTGERDDLKGKLDEAQKVDHSEQIAKAVKDLAAVSEIARQILGKKDVEKIDGMNCEEIKKAVILAKFPKLDLEGQHEKYIQARYDGIVDAVADEKQKDQGKKILDGAGSNADEIDGEKARADGFDALKEASRAPLTS